jgi:hypothetical protein
MASLKRWAGKLLKRSPSIPLRFPNAGFDVINESEVLEEEQFDKFKQGQYFPVNIGAVYANKYQVIGKLGFGTTSTVWLSRNLQ